MAISKVIYKASADATPETWMDATTATAAAADITAPKTAMLADGVMTTGTGSGGGGGITPVLAKDVNFIDYDGTIVYSYTKAEFALLDALPANPTHDGLTAQGWNWDLADAKTYVASYGKLWVGQMYVTSSGNSEIDITLGQGRLSPYLGIAVNGTVEVDWGDGSAAQTITGSSTSTQIRTQHTYPAPGEYTIIISSVSGCYRFYGDTTYSLLSANNGTASNNRVYSYAVSAVRVGNSAALANYGFYYCGGLKYITIPKNISIPGSTWPQYCYSLQSLTIPNTITILSLQNNYCYSFKNISFPKGITSISNEAFYNNYNLQSVCVPDGITGIPSNMFYGCTKLSSIVIPSSVTSIGTAAFSGCRGLGEIHFKPTTPPTVSNSNAWTNIPTDCIIYVPYSADHSILDTYKAASNYPNPSTYTYMEETA